MPGPAPAGASPVTAMPMPPNVRRDRHGQACGDVETVLSHLALECLLMPGLLISRAPATPGRVATVHHRRPKDMLHVISQAGGISNV